MITLYMNEGQQSNYVFVTSSFFFFLFNLPTIIYHTFFFFLIVDHGIENIDISHNAVN
jgi:hypothetical protein